MDGAEEAGGHGVEVAVGEAGREEHLSVAVGGHDDGVGHDGLEGGEAERICRWGDVAIGEDLLRNFPKRAYRAGETEHLGGFEVNCQALDEGVGSLLG